MTINQKNKKKLIYSYLEFLLYQKFGFVSVLSISNLVGFKETILSQNLTILATFTYRCKFHANKYFDSNVIISLIQGGRFFL
jgi:hypothetical protein